MASTITDLETTIKTLLDTISSIKLNAKYEPKVFPAKLPATTLFFVGFDDHYWKWTLRLYITLKEAQTAQTSMKTIIPDIVDAICSNANFLINAGEVYALLDRENPVLMCELALFATR